MNNNLIIIHFNPIDAYPPAVNLLRTFIKSKPDFTIILYATLKIKTFINSIPSSIGRIRIFPFSTSKPRFIRFLFYLYFNLYVFIALLYYRPRVILYYETLSSFAVTLYCLLKRWNVSLYIHYHEYTSEDEYNRGMFLNKIFHIFEKLNYSKAEWISHTNKDRLRLFKNDNPKTQFKRLEVLANYPPSSWIDTIIKKKINSSPIKIVYLGAISNDTMYITEFAEWVLNKNGYVIWDIYSNNFSDETRRYIDDLNTEYINFFDSVEYDKIPDILNVYDIGVVLYRGHILNYVYNVPNKLFEYLACGLDVWYPKELLSCKEYKTLNTYPKVLEIDFTDLKNFILEEAMDKQKLSYRKFNNSCEVELVKLINAINTK